MSNIAMILDKRSNSIFSETKHRTKENLFQLFITLIFAPSN